MTDVRGRYYAWRNRHPQWAEMPIDAFTDVYRYGARDAMRASSEFAGLIQQLRELIWWFEVHEEDDVEERGRAWGESNAIAEEHAIRHMDGELEDLPF